MATNPPTARPKDGASYADVLSRLAVISTRISANLRTLGIGIVVFCWGLFTADKGLALDVAARHRIWIVITAAIAILGLLFDLFQAVAGYWIANRLRTKMEAENQATGFYDYRSLLYRSQTFFCLVSRICG
ncbi:MAG: hypothetical protein ACYCPS_06880 [Candidatus Saccharimonadales bacterium]